MQNTVKLISGHKPKMIAHRGVSGLETENTAAAFIAAGNRSYFGIETDIYVTADGDYACFHDHTTKRLSADNVKVEDCSLETLQKIHLHSKDGTDRADLTVASLREYVAICKKYGKIAVPELKSTFTQEQITEICNIFANYGYLDHTVFIAFDIENLIKIRNIHPNQRVQYLSWELTPEVLETAKERKMDVDIGFHGITKEQIDDLHANGLEVNVWTVNTLEDADEVIAKGVDYITTNILE